MSRGSRWLPWEIMLLIQSRDPDDVARITERTRIAVLQKMTRLKIKSAKPRGRKRIYTVEQRAEIVRLYLDGNSQYKVAEIVGCSHSTVSNVVTEYFKENAT